MDIGRLLRVAAHRWHCFIARWETPTRLYVGFLSGLARRVPSRLSAMIEWALTGQNIPWKPLAFAPRPVVVGRHTTIRLTPHLGEFDQAALFGNRLESDRAVFSWLERHACGRYDAVLDIGANVGLYSLFFDASIRLCQAAGCSPSMRSNLPGRPSADCSQTCRSMMRAPFTLIARRSRTSPAYCRSMRRRGG